jgi:hypothetical protein
MIELNDITGFVTCMYDTFWWLGCVLSVSEENITVLNILGNKSLERTFY